VAEDVREEVRELDQKIRAIQDEIDSISRQKSVLAEQRAYLANLEQFAASSSAIELTHGILNADTLKSLTLFLFEQRRSTSAELLDLEVRERDLCERRELLNRERGVLSAGSSRTVREAVLFVNVTDPQGADVRLRYLVEGATWSPSYNVRADDNGSIVVEYQASIRQMSGEDWGDVQMTLSTATPSLVAKAPALVPLKVTLAAFAQPPLQQQAGGVSARKGKRELMQERDELEKARNYAGVATGQKDGKEGLRGQAEGNLDLVLNDNAAQMQMLDILERAANGPADKVRLETEGLSVSYKLTARASLPSRADQQLVQIAQLKMPAEFYRVATPVLTSYIYREASVVNSTEMVLLAGPASTYIEGQFVGHGEIPTVTTGEAFTVGLGVDSTMRAERELADRGETVQGGNRVLTFTYRMNFENFGDKAKTIRVLDRLPVGKEPEVKVTFLNSQQPLVESDSQRSADNEGLIRWDVDVPPTASGAEAFGFTYTYKLEYDKNMLLNGGPELAQAE
jgi:hypothetical protein